MIANRDEIARTPLREDAVTCIEAGVRAAHPASILEEKVSVDDGVLHVGGTTYDLDSYRDIYVIGGGNVAGHVAVVLEDLLGDRITAGVVVTDDPVATQTIEVFEGDYPVPSERCMAGTRQVLDIADDATEDDLVVTALSGGGSPLLSAPVADISLSDLQSITERLFANGVKDEEVNVVRKHLSAVKGGQLARTAAPADVVTLVFSDVVGDVVNAVASGPTLPDESTYSDALDVLERYDINTPDRIREHLERGRNGTVPETPTEGASAFESVTYHVLASNITALRGAKKAAQDEGYEAIVLSSRFRGSAQEAAKILVAIGEECCASGTPVEPPAVIIAGGQTTTQTTHGDELGPNQEFALSGAIELGDLRSNGAALASVATDGFDGFADTAGAVVDSTTAYPMADAWNALNSHQAAEYLSGRGDRVQIDTTGTNVNDIHLLVLGED